MSTLITHLFPLIGAVGLAAIGASIVNGFRRPVPVPVPVKSNRRRR